MKTRDLLTPAVPYTVTETETALGGRVPVFTAGATVWGDFQPDRPALDGDSVMVEEADFVCRSATGLMRGGKLTIKGADWRIVSVSEATDRVTIRIERVAL